MPYPRGDVIRAGADIALAAHRPTGSSIGRALSHFWWPARFLGVFDSKPHRMLSGEINLDTGRVDVCATNPRYCQSHKKKSALLNDQLSLYLQGLGPAPTRGRAQYLVSEIDKANAMRIRPPTTVELNAWGQSTPSTQALMSRAYGRRGGRVSARRRRTKKKRVLRSVRRSVKRRAPRGRAHLVRGSAAAKRYMARLRRMPRRRRSQSA